MNYYETLGISKNATEKEIKKSYKNLIKKYHPDIFKGDKTVAESKTKEINEAYEVLSNPSLKKDYDDMLASKFENNNIENSYDSNYGSPVSNYYSYNHSEPFFHKKYTTNYYGVSRDDLNKNQKANVNVSNNLYLSPNKIVIIFALLLAIIFIILMILLSSLKSMLSNNYINSISANSSNNSIYDTNDIPYVYFGLSFSDVKSMLGNPDYIEASGDNTYAYYGNSYIIFDNDNKVIDWQNNGDFYTDASSGNELKKIYNYINSTNFYFDY